MKSLNFKFTLLSTLLVILFFSFSSCGDSKKEESTTGSGLNIDDDYYEFQGFNLKDFDIPAIIMLPDETANIGASTKPEVIHAEDDFKWEIIVGQNYHLLIDDWGDYTDMVVSRKKELKELEFYKINYLIDDKDFILYEQELKVDGSSKASSTVGIPHKSYHVYAQKVIDGVTYVFRSRDEGYEKLIIELIAKSIKSVKPLKTT
jgi:hypothetical protein